MPLRVCSSRRVYLSRDHQSWGRRECDLDSFVQISRNASCGLIMSVSSRLWRRPSLSLFHAWHSWTKSNSKRVKPILPSVVSFQWSFFKWLHWLKTRLSWNPVMKCSHEKKRSLFSPLLESVMICVSSNLESGNDDDSVGDNKNYSFLIQVWKNDLQTSQITRLTVVDSQHQFVHQSRSWRFVHESCFSLVFHLIRLAFQDSLLLFGYHLWSHDPLIPSSKRHHVLLLLCYSADVFVLLWVLLFCKKLLPFACESSIDSFFP